MMKRLLAFVLCFALLPLAAAYAAVEDEDTSIRLYTIRTRVSTRVYSDCPRTHIGSTCRECRNKSVHLSSAEKIGFIAFLILPFDKEEDADADHEQKV